MALKDDGNRMKSHCQVWCEMGFIYIELYMFDMCFLL